MHRVQLTSVKREGGKKYSGKIGTGKLTEKKY